MQVVCKDGTAIQCPDFDAIDSEVLLYQEPERRETRDEEEEADEEEERRAAGMAQQQQVQGFHGDQSGGLYCGPGGQ